VAGVDGDFPGRWAPNASSTSKKTPGTNVSFSLCYRNLIHASDAIETANKEIALWFKGDELIAWTPCATPFLYE